jgi:hypothetical protein
MLRLYFENPNESSGRIFAPIVVMLAFSLCQPGKGEHDQLRLQADS